MAGVLHVPDGEGGGPMMEGGVQVPLKAKRKKRKMEDEYERIEKPSPATAPLGGFGNAPKFPRPAIFNFLLRYQTRKDEGGARDMTLHTLRRMWAGGMYDHLGGGFHRYSVDAYWRVPHFEKMLYDQAHLVWSYLEAYQITREDFFAQVAREVLDYVLRDMTHPEGGFYSAEDADSAADPDHPDEKTEGAFYLWRTAEIVEILGEQEAEIFNYLYGVSASGNTISDPHGEFQDRNVLYAAYSLAEAAKRFKRPEKEIAQLVAAAKAKLFAARESRLRPHLDDKIITAWNGLMISAFARAYQVLEDRKYLAAAARAATFILTKNSDAQTQTERVGDVEKEFVTDAAQALREYADAIELEWYTKKGSAENPMPGNMQVENFRASNGVAVMKISGIETGHDSKPSH